MSWTDIFKSKSTKLKPDPTIRWFGKLPTYADYYSSRADEEWVVEFHDWIMKGYEQFHTRSATRMNRITPGPDGKPPSRRLPISSCILRLPRSGMTVFAVLQDYGGDMRGRPFPLWFYTGLPSVMWPGPTSDRIVGAWGILRRLGALRAEVERFFKIPGRFDAVFGDRQIDFGGVDEDVRSEAWIEQARQINMTEWCQAAQLLPPKEELAEWLGLMARRGNTIAQLESEDFEPTLCFGLAAGMPMDVQVAGWIRWLEARMDLGRRALSLIVVDEPAEHMTPRLVVLARQLVPEDFLLLTSLGGDLQYLDHVTELKPDSRARPTCQDEPVHAGTWVDFVGAGAAAPADARPRTED